LAFRFSFGLKLQFTTQVLAKDKVAQCAMSLGELLLVQQENIYIVPEYMYCNVTGRTENTTNK